MKPYEAVPFTNDKGQVIQPGQSCIVVTKGYGGGVNTYKGRYLGVRTSKDWRGNDQHQVVAEVVAKKGGYIHPETDQLMSYDAKKAYEAAHPGVSLSYDLRPVVRITNLYLNMIYPSTFD